MKEIIYYDRVSRTEKKEKVYGQFFLSLLYGNKGWRRLFGCWLLPLIARVSFFSQLYGFLQKSPLSRCKVVPFIRTFEVDASEFASPVASFASFNDFFIRRLNMNCRPFTQGEDRAILPADARYLVFPKLKEVETFWVKGQTFSVDELIQDSSLAARYREGAMVIARLCPVDYHRFHFPCVGVPGKSREIPGPLFSVNPIALRQRLGILSENKRMITEFETEHFGKMLYIEVGATYVGTIHQTYRPEAACQKGDEKGYFSFGGSCLILLFEPQTIQFEQDLIDYSAKTIEVRGLLGQPLGHALRSGVLP